MPKVFSYCNIFLIIATVRACICVQIFTLVTTLNRTRASVTSYVLNAAAAVMRRRLVDAALTLATMSVSARLVTMAADYVTSAIVGITSLIAMAIVSAGLCPKSIRHVSPWFFRRR